MTTMEHLEAALQHLVDIDQETLSVSLVENGSSYDTQDECYNQARIWLERAINCGSAAPLSAGRGWPRRPDRA